jgi:hypothetical protein
MPRFTISRHESPRGLHWDLFLETGQVLRTWALPQAPVAGLKMTCEALPNHRAAYLDYSGPISGGRGTVTPWDCGSYNIIEASDRELILDLAGGKVHGRAVLRAVPEQAGKWRFTLSSAFLLPPGEG